MSKKAKIFGREAFTIVELLAVMAVVGILVAILIPVVSSIRQKSWESAATSNLRQLGQATALYVVDNGGRLPIESTNSSYSDPPWYISLSSYISITLRSPTSNGFVQEDTTSILRNPASSTELPVNFAPSITCRGTNGGLKVIEIDEPSKKVWLTTSTGSYYYNPYNRMYIEYPHNDRANMLFFDGHVELVDELAVIEQGRDLIDPRL